MKSSFYIFLFILILTLPFVGCKKEDSSTGPGPSDDNTPTTGIVVVLNSTPSGSDIDIDGVPTGQKTPYTLNWDNSKENPHRFRIYNAADRKIIDTSFYVFKDKKYTINADNYILWRGSWSGNKFVGTSTDGTRTRWYWTIPVSDDTLVVPLTQKAKITIYFNDERCGTTKKAAWGSIGNFSFEINQSPTVLTTDDLLTRGAKGKLTIGYQWSTNCMPEYGVYCCDNGITLTNIILETY